MVSLRESRGSALSEPFVAPLRSAGRRWYPRDILFLWEWPGPLESDVNHRDRDIWLRDFRDGRPGALERIYADHARDVEQTIRRGLARLGRYSDANLADVSQEVFLKAMTRPARLTYDGARDYRPFLIAIARNVLSDWARASFRERLDPSLLEASLESAALQAKDELAEVLSHVSTCIENLPPDLRAVHERRFVAAEPQERAARALGISRQTLRTREKRLLARLRLSLKQAGWPPTALSRPSNQKHPAASRAR